MIAQLGCLAPDTPILLESGIELPISDVQKGDRVLCYDTEVGSLVSEVVAETWKREADDIWEVEWSNGYKLRITGEHPVFTGQGWKLYRRSKLAGFPRVCIRCQKDFRVPSSTQKGKFCTRTCKDEWQKENVNEEWLKSGQAANTNSKASQLDLRSVVHPCPVKTGCSPVIRSLYPLLHSTSQMSSASRSHVSATTSGTLPETYLRVIAKNTVPFLHIRDRQVL